MGEVQFFSTRALGAMVIRFGIPVVLLLASPHVTRSQQPPSVSDLVRRFESETVFWRQIEVAKAIVAAKDLGVLPKLESWLTHEDRHLRGNAAFIYAGLGDARGFDVINGDSPRLFRKACGRRRLCAEQVVPPRANPRRSLLRRAPTG